MTDNTNYEGLSIHSLTRPGSVNTRDVCQIFLTSLSSADTKIQVLCMPHNVIFLLILVRCFRTKDLIFSKVVEHLIFMIV